MCSGRIDMELLFKAFANGADGVFIGGCRLGECNYITHGNYHALNTTLLSKKLLKQIGLNPERLRVEFMTSGDGLLFTQMVDDFTTKIERLGRLGEAEGLDPDEVESRLQKVIRLIPFVKMKMREKLGEVLENPDDWETHFRDEDVARLIEDAPSYYIDPEKCRACMLCSRRCPVDAIDGGKRLIHIIDQEKCIRCGTCLAVCPPRFGAVKEIRGAPVPPPIPKERRKIQKKK